jgi:4-amino-4-deoxy-L-arabinose transferase-like glycosyltransferase
MTVLIVLSAYAATRWLEERNWKWALWAGALGGLAALVKIVAAFLVGGMMLAVGLSVVGLRKAVKDKQLWVIAALLVLPAFIYYILIQGAGNASSYFESWGIALSSLILQPTFYFQWLDRLGSLISVALIFAGVVGVLLSRPPLRTILVGLWAGYFIYGLSLPHLIITHDYYSLQLVPALALALAPLADAVFNRVAQENKFWNWAFTGMMALAVAFPLWTARSALLGQDYRQDAAYWANFREILPPNGRILALTPNYGHPIAYYGWQRVNLWPTTQELSLAQQRGTDKDFQKFFDNKAEKNDFFLVTSKNQLGQQPQLEATLQTYPVYAEGGGYIIYDLRGAP